MKFKSVTAGIILAGQALAVSAQDVALSSDTLVGKWRLGESGSCASGRATYVLFRDNGTSEYGNAGEVSAIGFWKTDGKSIIVHALTAPGQHQEYHPFLRQSYNYEYINADVVGIEKDLIKVEKGPAGQRESYELIRCP